MIEKTNSYLNVRENSIQLLLEERSAEDVIEPGNRDIELVVVGLGKIAGLDRMVDYLVNQFQMPISVVSFSAFLDDDNKILLVRELAEQDIKPPVKRTGTRTMEQVFELADDAGVGDSFRQILAAANELGLYPRSYKKSIMYTPPFQRNRMLFTVCAKKKGNGLHTYAGPSAFAEFYPVIEEEASSLLGINNSGWYSMAEAEVGNFITGLKKLFKIISEKSEPE